MSMINNLLAGDVEVFFGLRLAFDLEMKYIQKNQMKGEKAHFLRKKLYGF